MNTDAYVMVILVPFFFSTCGFIVWGVGGWSKAGFDSKRQDGILSGRLTGLEQIWLQASSLFGSRFTSFYLLSMGLAVFCLTLIVSLYTVFTDE